MSCGSLTLRGPCCGKPRWARGAHAIAQGLIGRGASSDASEAGLQRPNQAVYCVLSLAVDAPGARPLRRVAARVVGAVQGPKGRNVQEQGGAGAARGGPYCWVGQAERRLLGRAWSAAACVFLHICNKHPLPALHHERMCCNVCGIFVHAPMFLNRCKHLLPACPPRAQVFQRMKLEDPERYMRLEHLCSKMYFDARDVYQVRGKWVGVGVKVRGPRATYLSGGWEVGEG